MLHNVEIFRKEPLGIHFQLVSLLVERLHPLSQRIDPDLSSQDSIFPLLMTSLYYWQTVEAYLFCIDWFHCLWHPQPAKATVDDNVVNKNSNNYNDYSIPSDKNKNYNANTRKAGHNSWQTTIDELSIYHKTPRMKGQYPSMHIFYGCTSIKFL